MIETPSLAEFYHQQLFADCVPFWFPRAVDEIHGGFLHCFDLDGSLVDDDKSVWAQGRISWMLLTIYQDHERRPEWLTWAESGLKFLTEKCVDFSDGRMFVIVKIFYIFVSLLILIIGYCNTTIRRQGVYR